MADAVSARHLEGVDLVGLAVGGLALMASLTMGLVIAPVLGCVPPTIVADGIARRATATARAARTFAAFVICFAALTLFPIRASLPLFSMHSAVE